MELRYNMFLLGNLTSKIIGHKLPMNLQILKRLYYITQNNKNTDIHEAETITVREVEKFWKSAGILIQHFNSS